MTDLASKTDESRISEIAGGFMDAFDIPGQEGKAGVLLSVTFVPLSQARFSK